MSFYFDDRLFICQYDKSLDGKIQQVINDTGDCVVDKLSNNNVVIETDIVTAISELKDFVAELVHGQGFLWGEFPDTYGNDIGKVTLTLPDADGTVREHSH